MALLRGHDRQRQPLGQLQAGPYVFCASLLLCLLLAACLQTILQMQVSRHVCGAALSLQM